MLNEIIRTLFKSVDSLKKDAFLVPETCIITKMKFRLKKGKIFLSRMPNLSNGISPSKYPIIVKNR